MTALHEKVREELLVAEDLLIGQGMVVPARWLRFARKLSLGLFGNETIVYVWVVSRRIGNSSDIVFMSFSEQQARAHASTLGEPSPTNVITIYSYGIAEHR